MNEELIRSVHSFNERLPLSELERGIVIYKRLLLILEEEAEGRRNRVPEVEPSGLF
jgi:hypothetical protein